MTELELLNKSLSYLGQAKVTALPPTSSVGNLVYSWLSSSIDEVLNDCAWGFARKRVIINPAPVQPEFGYTNRFPLPIDLVGICSINGEAWERQSQFVSTEGSYLLGNFDVLRLVYTSRVSDIEDWTTPEANLLAIKIASRACVQVTNNLGLFANLDALYKKTLEDLATRSGKGDTGFQDPYIFQVFNTSNYLKDGRSTGTLIPDFSGTSETVGTHGGGGNWLTGVVRYDADQTSVITLDEAQVARSNIGAVSQGSFDSFSAPLLVRVTALEGSVATLTTSVAENTDGISDAWIAITSTNSRVDTLTVTVTGNSTSISNINTSITTINNNLTNLTGRVGALEQETEGLIGVPDFGFPCAKYVGCGWTPNSAYPSGGYFIKFMSAGFNPDAIGQILSATFGTNPHEDGYYYVRLNPSLWYWPAGVTQAKVYMSSTQTSYNGVRATANWEKVIDDPTLLGTFRTVNKTDTLVYYPILVQRKYYGDTSVWTAPVDFSMGDNIELNFYRSFIRA